MTKVGPPRTLLTALLFAVLLAAFPARADVLARVVAVHDGDTVTVLSDQRRSRVRLTDIDAPELGQPFGKRSKMALSELCFGKVAALDIHGRDRYGRTLAGLKCDGVDANAQQVRRGYAWVFTRYAKTNSPLYAMQLDARTARAHPTGRIGVFPASRSRRVTSW
jgi:endonuclease YncB( thermonuclease family)